MTIVAGCDNAAVDLKNTLVASLRESGVTVEDAGCTDSQDPTPYPKIAERVCRHIIDSGYVKRGLLVCGTGVGMCICANKFPGIRAAVGHDAFSAERSILSNDGNVICFGARVIGPELAKKILREWVSLEFKDGPSTPKVQAIAELERQTMK
nr:RpiB/LacA/LacB family sugar-phosphate isomerase [uncultured Oscillibacter sp.]